MLAIHPNARTTPAVRAEIARSHESSGVLAQRYGVSTETIRKWRKRGPADCQDRSARPHKLPWKASEEERAIVCALRRSTGFPLDDLTFVVTHFLPHLNRDAVYRILKAEGLNRLPPSRRSAQAARHLQGVRGRLRAPGCEAPAQAAGQGWRHPQALPLSSPSTAARAGCTWPSRMTRPPPRAVAFLKEAIRAFPFQVTHVLTDRGSCFVADAFEAACRKLKVEHRTTRPYTPRTNGMVERFNGRVQREVLGITIHSHADLEILLQGFNRAYNARRQRVLKGRSPDEAVRRRMEANPSWPARTTSHLRPVRLAQGPPGRRSRQGGLASRQLALLCHEVLEAAGTSGKASGESVLLPGGCAGL